MRLRCLVFFLCLGSAACFAQSATPPLGHIVVVAMENHSYSDVVGSSSMPYYNSLINQYGLTQNFYGNIHGSFPNYAMLTTGELITTAGWGLPDDFPISIDNLVRELSAAGKTWKVYAENLPSAGYTGGDSYPYVKRHNPFAYMSDVLNSSAQAANMVPFSPQFANDVASNTLPSFSFVVPNAEDDSEDCPGGGSSCTDSAKLSNADQWLQTNIGPLLSNPDFQNDGLLIIWWDEGNASDTANGGGKLAITLIGPMIKPGFRSTTMYRHENVLRTIAEGFGLGFPGASIYVPSMAEFFGANTSPGSSPGAISGQVTNISTGGAISGTTVSFSGGSATTDSAGHYSFTSVAAGTYNVSASHTGYFLETKSVTVSSSATSTLNFALATGGKVAGTVTNSSGVAISGASVNIAGGSIATTVNTTTSSSGTYNSNWIPVGTYTVTVSATGFTNQSQTVNVPTGSTATLNFTLQ